MPLAPPQELGGRGWGPTRNRLLLRDAVAVGRSRIGGFSMCLILRERPTSRSRWSRSSSLLQRQGLALQTQGQLPYLRTALLRRRRSWRSSPFRQVFAGGHINPGPPALSGTCYRRALASRVHCGCGRLNVGWLLLSQLLAHERRPWLLRRIQRAIAADHQPPRFGLGGVAA